jgi:hypothetical protein
LGLSVPAPCRDPGPGGCGTTAIARLSAFECIASDSQNQAPIHFLYLRISFIRKTIVQRSISRLISASTINHDHSAMDHGGMDHGGMGDMHKCSMNVRSTYCIYFDTRLIIVDALHLEHRKPLPRLPLVAHRLHHYPAALPCRSHPHHSWLRSATFSMQKIRRVRRQQDECFTE